MKLKYNPLLCDEAGLQHQCVRYLDSKLRILYNQDTTKYIVAKFDNEGKKNYKKFLLLGGYAGISDLLVNLQCKQDNTSMFNSNITVYFEFKHPQFKTPINKLSINQRIFISNCLLNKIFVFTISDYNVFKIIIDNYFYDFINMLVDKKCMDSINTLWNELIIEYKDKDTIKTIDKVKIDRIINNDISKYLV